MSKLGLDEVLTDLDATANILQQIDQGDALLVHSLIDADKKRLSKLDAIDDGLLVPHEALIHLVLGSGIHLGADGDSLQNDIVLCQYRK